MTTTPTIKEIYDGIIANFETEFSISTSPWGQAVLIPIAGVFSMVIWLCYLAIATAWRNSWYDLCDHETLIRYGLTILGRYPYNATKARYEITVTGTVGATIPSSTVFKSDPTSLNPGKLYQVATSYTLTSSPQNITVNALQGGDSSTLAVGNTLTSTTPLLNVNKTAAVATEVINPENAEDWELYRSKIDDKVKLTPGSWNAVDYRLVGTGVTGVKRVYAYGASETEVDVYLRGTVDVANPGPSASPTVISDYETALDAVRPLPAFTINVASSTIRNVDVTITMGTFPEFTTAQKTVIEAALRAFIHSVEPFIAAADIISQRNDVIATYNLSEVISKAVPGYGFSSVTFTVAGVPTTVWTADNGEIAFFNSIAYA